MEELESLVLSNGGQPDAISEAVEVDGIPICWKIKAIPRPEFDGRLPLFRRRVLVRIDAFSCNYRDKTLSLTFAEQSRRLPMSSKTRGFGSEFAGTVVAAGCDISSVHVGDRVMPDASYPNVEVSNFRPGIVTNGASKRWAIFEENKLCVVPDWMTIPQAAAYSLAAQTAFSMVRKSGVGRSSTALVASARSSTSLTIIRTLQALNVRIIAVSSSQWSKEEIRRFGDTSGVEFLTTEASKQRIPSGACDAIFDPFADINFPNFAPKLRKGGVYMTCGFKNQHSANFKESDNVAQYYYVLQSLIVNNQRLEGNCIGTAQDLKDALNYGESVCVPIDSVYGPRQASDFLRRSFIERKFGKVVLDYTRSN